MNEPCTSQELIAYYLFGRMADKRKLLKDDADEPLSEIFEHEAYEARACESDRLRHCCWFCRPVQSPTLRQAEPGPGLPASFNGAASPENSAQLGIEEFFNDPTAHELDRPGTGRQPGAEDPGRGHPDRQQRDSGAARGVPSLRHFRGRRGAGQTQPLHASGSRREPTRHTPRQALSQSAAGFPGRPQLLLADGHLEAVAECQGRGSAALPRRQRAAELRRDPPGRRDCRELLQADGARQTARDSGSDHRASGAKPRDRQGQEGSRPRHRAGRPAFPGRGSQEPERKADRQAGDHRGREPHQLPRRSLPAACRTRRPRDSSI